MRIAYILTWNLHQDDGVSQKVWRQVEKWRQFGHEVEVFCASELGKEQLPWKVNLYRRMSILRNPFRFFVNRDAYDKLCKEVEEFAPDVAYLRWEFHKAALERLMHEVPTVIELNAIYSRELKSNMLKSISKFLRYFYFRMTCKRFEKVASGFVAVSYEILEECAERHADTPSVVIPNSTDIDEGKNGVAFSPKNRGLPRIVYMIGGDQPWHGLDEFLRFAESTIDELEFDLVTRYDLDLTDIPSNVETHAFLDRREFRKVFERASCGLGTVALHAKNMDEASPLKVRDYLDAGLPIILPYDDTAFVRVECPDWILQIPNVPGNLNGSKGEILDFVQRINGRRVSGRVVAPYVGSSYWENERMSFLEKIAGMGVLKNKAIALT